MNLGHAAGIFVVIVLSRSRDIEPPRKAGSLPDNVALCDDVRDPHVYIIQCNPVDNCSRIVASMHAPANTLTKLAFARIEATITLAGQAPGC